MEMNVDLLSMGVANNGPDASTPSAPASSNAHGIDRTLKFVAVSRESNGLSTTDTSSSAQDLEEHAKGASSRNSSPVNCTPITKHEPSPHLEPDTRPDGSAEPQPGTSQDTDFDSKRNIKSGFLAFMSFVPFRFVNSRVFSASLNLDVLLAGKLSKRARGRPRGYSRNAGSLDRSLAAADSLDDLAGPSQREGSATPDRTLLGNANSNNTEQLQEMSIRGLNLFRYASVSEEGMYRCIPCEKEHVTRTFKNKYSFQRHAYLYHEGNQRKVFPCLVCGREFSRPDKLKHHLKTVHDYAVPREYSNAYYALP